LTGKRWRQISFINLGHGQDAVAVQVALHRQVHHGAVGAARHDHRAFELQRQHFFEHAGHLADRAPGGGQLGGGLHAHLALAVVAHAGGFQNAGQQVGRARRPAVRPSRSPHRARRARRSAQSAPSPAARSCATATALAAGDTGRCAGQRGQASGGHVLELGGHRIAQAGQLGQAVRVFVAGLDVVVAHQAGGAGPGRHRARR
jgi:hypothetical protein